jgi:Tol biopolymer transport system component
MPLAPGTKLGSYEIVASIGAGGMGEVYRARDPKLNRDVAIKVLPEHLALTPDALARFEREAQAVASLSHPNIMAIHDFGVVAMPTEGNPAAKAAYAVSELLEGETLRAKLAGSSLPVRKAVDYALQIVHGIAAAHQKGVIHRDLKPENIYITHDGRVKILDFGLAKATAPAGEGSVLQTQSGLGTSPGTVMGTVGYMSPEQVRGLPVDQRTDIFSFGVVLYEMLSGLRAFSGDSNVETMNAILKEDPPEFSSSGSIVPLALDRVVRRCLEKNANERFHSAHDLGLALEALSGSGSSVQSGASPAVAAPVASRARLAPFLIVAIVLSSVGYYAGKRVAAPAQVEPPAYHRLTFREGDIHSARYAGDGKTIVYSATWVDEPRRLYTTREGSPDSMALPFGAADVASISSSGELALILDRKSVRGYASTGTLARASLSGGAPRVVLENVQDADWLPDGSGFAAARYVDGRYRLEFPVGKTIYETGGYISDVRVSPDGASVAFADHPMLGDDRGSLALIDRAGAKRIVKDGYSSIQGISWSHDGKEVWFTASDQGNARTLFAATPAGVVRTVLRAANSMHLGDRGPDGGVLLWQEHAKSLIRGRARGETAERDLSWMDWSSVPRLTDDGKTLIFTEQGDGGGVEYSTYMRSMDGGPAVRLGSGNAFAVSPDGKWALTLRLTPEPAQFWLIPTGAGEPRQVTSGDLESDGGWFTSDGQRIIFSARAPGRPTRMYVQEISGGAAKPITEEGVAGPPSPDGTLVADEGKIYSADGGAPQPIPGYEPGDRTIGWSSDSRAVFVRHNLPSDDTQIFRIERATGRKTLVHHIPRQGTVHPGVWLVVTPDGSAYAYSYAASQSELFRITGLK